MPGIRFNYNLTLPRIHIYDKELTWVEFSNYLHALIYSYRGGVCLEDDIVTRLDNCMRTLVDNMLELSDHMTHYHCTIKTFSSRLDDILQDGHSLYEDIINIISDCSLTSNTQEPCWYIKKLLGVNGYLCSLVKLLDRIDKWNKYDMEYMYVCTHRRRF